MTTKTLKKKIHQYVDESHDAILKVVHTILEDHSKLKAINETDLSSNEVAELDLRWESYKNVTAKTFSLEEVSKELSKNKKRI